MDFFIQLLWNGLVSGALIALVALGLTLIYGVAGFIQFSHGEIVALGAYAFLVLHKLLLWPVLPASLGVLVFGIFLGILIEKIFFKPVRDKDSMVPLVISIGLSIFLQSLLLLTFGSSSQTISNLENISFYIPGSEVLVTESQVIAFISAIILMIILQIFLKKSRVGQSLRAVASNQNLAEIFGLQVDTSMRWIFGIGAGLAVIAGIFLGFEQNLDPMMGVMISVKAFSAVILGAIGSIRGAILGAFMIGLGESFLVGYGIISGGYQSAIPFFVLIIILLLKPEGLFGKVGETVRR